MDKHELRDLYIKETGNPFPDDIARYANWLEEKLTSTNTGSNSTCEYCKGDGAVRKAIAITWDYEYCPKCGCKLAKNEISRNFLEE